MKYITVLIQRRHHFKAVLNFFIQLGKKIDYENGDVPTKKGELKHILSGHLLSKIPLNSCL